MNEINDLYCANCGSNDVSLKEQDYGIDPATGYHDDVTFINCLDCLHKEPYEPQYALEFEGAGEAV